MAGEGSAHPHDPEVAPDRRDLLFRVPRADRRDRDGPQPDIPVGVQGAGAPVPFLHRQLSQAGRRCADRRSDAHHLGPAPSGGSGGRASLPGHQLPHRAGPARQFLFR